MELFGAMRAFVAVTNSGGFAPAARKAGVATSSLTRQVDALEAELGASLLERSTRRLTLTAARESRRAVLEETGRANFLGGVASGYFDYPNFVAYAELAS